MTRFLSRLRFIDPDTSTISRERTIQTATNASSANHFMTLFSVNEHHREPARTEGVTIEARSNSKQTNLKLR